MTQTDTPAVDAVYKAAFTPDSNTLTHLGEEMARFKNELGFPPSMFMDKCEEEGYFNSKEDKHKMIFAYSVAMIAHKRDSGAGEKALDRQREQNVKFHEEVEEDKEISIY